MTEFATKVDTAPTESVSVAFAAFNVAVRFIFCISFFASASTLLTVLAERISARNASTLWFGSIFSAFAIPLIFGISRALSYFKVASKFKIYST